MSTHKTKLEGSLVASNREAAFKQLAQESIRSFERVKRIENELIVRESSGMKSNSGQGSDDTEK